MLSFSAASYQGDDNNTRAAFKASADSACDLADHTLPPTGPKKTVPAHTEKQQPRSRNVSSIQQQALQPACHRRSYVQHCHAAPTSSRSVLERCRQGCLTVANRSSNTSSASSAPACSAAENVVLLVPASRSVIALLRHRCQLPLTLTILFGVEPAQTIVDLRARCRHPSVDKWGRLDDHPC